MDDLNDLDEALAARVQGRLEGRVAVVSGAGTSGDGVGVGYAIAVVLAAAGAGVVVLDRDEGAAGQTARIITERGDRVTPFRGDVTLAADCDRAAQHASDTFGRLDIVVNNAAILGSGSSVLSDDEAVLATIDVNLMGPIRLSRSCVPVMGDGGAIVNIGSLGAIRSFGAIDYSASKGGVSSLTMAMATELGARGIRVNAVCPGQVWTPMGQRRLVAMGYDDDALRRARQARAQGCPLGREGTGWDVATAVLFLASEEARWVTGTVLVVDGGQSCLPGSLG